MKNEHKNAMNTEFFSGENTGKTTEKNGTQTLLRISFDTFMAVLTVIIQSAPVRMHYKHLQRTFGLAHSH